MKPEPRPAARTPVTVILPAYDEEGAVGPQVEAVRRALRAQDWPHEIIVVDDGSRDCTGERAQAAGARVLRHPENRGYGAAIKTGILAAAYDAIVITDADGTYPAEAIPKLVAELQTADMVVAARTGAHVQVEWARRPAKWLLRWLAQHIAGRPIPDLNSGLRAFHRPCVLQYFPILSNRFSFTTTVTLALLADDYRVTYQPISYYARVGKSKIRPRGFMDFLILILRMSMMFQPLKVFVPLALACGGLGLAKVAFDVVALFERHTGPALSLAFEHVLSTSALLLLMLAVQLLLIGMVADGVVRRIAQHARPLVPSRAVTYSEASEGQA